MEKRWKIPSSSSTSKLTTISKKTLPPVSVPKVTAPKVTVPDVPKITVPANPAKKFDIPDAPKSLPSKPVSKPDIPDAVPPKNTGVAPPATGKGTTPSKPTNPEKGSSPIKPSGDGTKPTLEKGSGPAKPNGDRSNPNTNSGDPTSPSKPDKPKDGPAEKANDPATDKPDAQDKKEKDGQGSGNQGNKPTTTAAGKSKATSTADGNGEGMEPVQHSKEQPTGEQGGAVDDFASGFQGSPQGQDSTTTQTNREEEQSQEAPAKSDKFGGAAELAVHAASGDPMAILNSLLHKNIVPPAALVNILGPYLPNIYSAAKANKMFNQYEVIKMLVKSKMVSDNVLIASATKFASAGELLRGVGGAQVKAVLRNANRKGLVQTADMQAIIPTLPLGGAGAGMSGDGFGHDSPHASTDFGMSQNDQQIGDPFSDSQVGGGEFSDPLPGGEFSNAHSGDINGDFSNPQNGHQNVNDGFSGQQFNDMTAFGMASEEPMNMNNDFSGDNFGATNVGAADDQSLAPAFEKRQSAGLLDNLDESQSAQLVDELVKNGQLDPDSLLTLSLEEQILLPESLVDALSKTGASQNYEALDTIVQEGNIAMSDLFVKLLASKILSTDAVVQQVSMLNPNPIELMKTIRANVPAGALAAVIGAGGLAAGVGMLAKNPDNMKGLMDQGMSAFGKFKGKGKNSTTTAKSTKKGTSSRFSWGKRNSTKKPVKVTTLPAFGVKTLQVRAPTKTQMPKGTKTLGSTAARTPNSLLTGKTDTTPKENKLVGSTGSTGPSGIAGKSNTALAARPTPTKSSSMFNFGSKSKSSSGLTSSSSKLSKSKSTSKLTASKKV